MSVSRAVKGGSAEERLMSLLAVRYPVTVEEAALALGLRKDVVALTLKRLRSRGLVTLEEAGERTYAALSGAGFTLVGKSSGDAARAAKALKLPPTKPRDEDDPAFM